MKTNPLVERLKDLKELLECPDKLSNSDKILIEIEIKELKLKLPKDKPKRKKTPKNLNKRHYLFKDKAKYGSYHGNLSKRKRHLQKQANKIVRKSHLFSHRGSGYKKCFDLQWELW